MGFLPSFLPLEIITIADDNSIGLKDIGRYSYSDGATGRTGNVSQPTSQNAIDTNILLGTNDPRAAQTPPSSIISALNTATQNTSPTYSATAATVNLAATAPTTSNTPSPAPTQSSPAVSQQGATNIGAPAPTAPNAGSSYVSTPPPAPVSPSPVASTPPANNPPTGNGTNNANPCTAEYSPVISRDGRIFSNSCNAQQAGVTDYLPYNPNTDTIEANGNNKSEKEFDIKAFTHKYWPFLLIGGIFLLYVAKNKS
jgi:hypothetical protein